MKDEFRRLQERRARLEEIAEKEEFVVGLLKIGKLWKAAAESVAAKTSEEQKKKDLLHAVALFDEDKWLARKPHFHRHRLREAHALAH